MASLQQIAANRANAQHSTGPTSLEGKAKISHNALKTGLTGRTVLLPADDRDAYQAHVDRTFQQFAPQGDEEKRLTQSLADTLWRLERIPALEAGIYAIGRRECAAQFADEEDPAVRQALIEAQVFLIYRRDLNNLSIQEARLRRLYERDEAELRHRITERKHAETQRQAEENRRWTSAILHFQTARKYDEPFDPAEIGFEFSAEQIAAREQQRNLQAAIDCGRYYEYKHRGLLHNSVA